MKFLKWITAGLLAASLAACGGGGGSAGTNASGAPAAGAQTITFTAGPSLAASIAIATGDKIDSSDPIFYAERFAATVATSAGLPVVGATISLNVQYPGFYKGRFFRGTDNKVTGSVEYFCPSEDINNNDVNDLGEDRNGNGQLDPAKALVTATIEGSNVTDANGNVKILVRYPKRHANWVEYRLFTNVRVVGSEGSASFPLRTTYAAGDDETVSTPFVFSPYGVTSNCNDVL
jgi:hypothetical protein